MFYVPIKHLRPGMVLAKDLPSDMVYISLLTVGHELTPETIDKLNSHGIQGAYIESKLENEVFIHELIDPKFKNDMLISIKRQFGEYMSRSMISSGMYKSMATMAAGLVTQVVSNDEFFLNMIDIRDYDTYTYSHSMFVGLISVLIGIKMKLPRNCLIDLAMSGLLHDIGKLDIPLTIINKPGKLTDEEYDIIKEHPQKAVNRLRPNKLFSSTVLSGIESHHEKFDGTGYPYGLKGEKIPLYGRIMALADVFDALVSARSYRPGWSSGQAVEYMMGGSGTHYDHNILQIFLSVVAAYPVGTFVKLSTGDLAVVTKNNADQTLRPTVRIIDVDEPELGKEINLANDRKCLNITVIDTIDDEESLPDAIFGAKADVENRKEKATVK